MPVFVSNFPYPLYKDTLIDLYEEFVLGYQYTPIATSSIQFITGTWMAWTEAAMLDPLLAPVAMPLYYLSYAENRFASFVGWQAVDYQYDHGLYGVSKTDVNIAWGSLSAGALAPLAPYISDVSFGWDILNTNWEDFP